MSKSCKTIKATFDPEAAFDIKLDPVPWRREAAEFKEGLMTRQAPLLVMGELESRGRPESALHD